MSETIDVGKTKDKGQIFIGFPPSMYDKAKTPLTGTRKHIMLMDRDDCRWLIAALRKELK